MPPVVRLYQADRFEDAWEVLLMPWLKRRMENARQALHPSAIAVPSETCAGFLKSRLLEAGISLFGVVFLTPGALRERLLRQFPELPPVVIGEDLRLLMALAAESLGDGTVTHAIAQVPDDFVRAYDRLTAAGWPPESWQSEAARLVALRFSQSIERYGLQTIQQADRRLWAATAKASSLFNELLLYGFTAQHWHLFFLLCSALNVASSAAVCLLEWGMSNAHQAWQGTWEEWYGSAEPLVGSAIKPERPFSLLSANWEATVKGGGEDHASRAPVIYRVGADLREEADAIVAQTITFLAQANCTRLGLIFPKASALSREVVARLVIHDIPHFDALGYFPGRKPAQQLFEVWLRFQEQQQLGTFLALLRTLHGHKKVDEGTAKTLEDTLMRAFNEVLTEDFAVVKAYVLREWPDRASTAFLEAWSPLPERASLADFTEQSRSALTAFGWPEKREAYRNRARKLAQTVDELISRALYLKWLREVTREPGRTRHSLGRHAFARVQLLTFDEAEGLGWSHLILADLRTGQWPPERHESAFLNEEEIRCLNQQAVRMGSQGEGHITMAESLGWILSAFEERQLATERFVRLVDAPTVGLAVTATRTDETDGCRSSIPSDLLVRLYWTDRGTVLEEAVLKRLTEATAYWLEPLRQPITYRSAEAEASLRAYTSRRDRSHPFGEYEFSFREPPPKGVQLSCTAWDEFLKRPATVWLRDILKVTKRPSLAEESNSRLAVGAWVHSWLCLRGDDNGFTPPPGGDEWGRLVCARAEAVRQAVAGAYAEAGRGTPDWWLAEWSTARHYAKTFASILSSLSGWSRAASEYSLPEGAVAALPGEMGLPVRGRIDLLLTDADRPWPSTGSAWIIDFKTGGKSKSLKERGFAKGEGLQLGLYALVLYGLGCRQVAVSLLLPEGELLQPQLDLEALLQPTGLWAGLAQVQQTGVFGQLGPIRSKFTFSGDYPLATLAVDPAVLTAKWRLSHPALPLPSGLMG